MDAGEFQAVLREHQRTVFSIALRITRQYQTAEEVAQDVFLELHRSAERLDGPDHIRFWLRRVAVHRATDALRRQSRRPEAAAEMWAEEFHGGLGSDGAGPASALPDGLASKLETMVGTLPEAMRVAVVLRYGEEMTPEEISRLLGQPVASVKSNLQRGLKLLRQKAEVMMKGYKRVERA